MDHTRPVVSPSSRWDENTKTRFKWKFYHLAVELNTIILLVAVSVLIFFLIHSSYTIPCIVGMLALALVISLDFKKRYRETKEWLDENAKDKILAEDGH
jgi:hypothetical protein